MNRLSQDRPGSVTVQSGQRRLGRRAALQALYLIDVRGCTAAQAMAEYAAQFRDSSEDLGFPSALVHGVLEHQEDIDQRIEKVSHRWRLDRMSRLDRSLLRLGVYELLYFGDTPRNVAINEAIELAKSFGNENSAAFVNGILDPIARSGLGPEDGAGVEPSDGAGNDTVP